MRRRKVCKARLMRGVWGRQKKKKTKVLASVLWLTGEDNEAGYKASNKERRPLQEGIARIALKRLVVLI